MIRLDELHQDQLAQLSLRWVPITELYSEDDLDDDVDNDNLRVLTYADIYTLDQVFLFELERMLNEGASRDRMLLALREYADDLDGAEWLLDEGDDDLHTWGQLRTGRGD